MITLDYNNMMEKFITNGIKEEELQNLSEQAEKAVLNIEERRKKDLEFLELPYNQNDIVEDIMNYKNEMKHIETFVVLGIGGSALGTIALQNALNNPYYNELSKENRKGLPKLYVIDNVDPEILSSLLEIIDINKTLFNVISKSGETTETMSQFKEIKTLLKVKENIVCTTDKENGSLIKIAKEEGYKCFYIPRNVGGRFSVLTPVSLLPLAFCGINIKSLLEGAALMDEKCKSTKISENPALAFAILNYLSMKDGKNIVAMMPYANSLKYMSDWFAQLWAESLGKKFDRKGNVVNVGSTPIKTLGATDQHSMLQLFSEGPYDKILVFIGTKKYRKEFSDHGKLIQIEQAATGYALSNANRQNMTITLDEINEKSIGMLINFFQIAVSYTAEFLDINAFDQPGVEETKQITHALLNGNEDFKTKEKSEKYII